MLDKKISKHTSILPFNSPWFILIIFSVLGLIGILNHSMWRDELNPWLIVRDSESFRDLIANIHYEGHPVLWYFSLAILIRIVDNPIIMQIFHLAITIVSVTLFCLYSPLLLCKFFIWQLLLFRLLFFTYIALLTINKSFCFRLGSFLFTNIF